MFCDHLTQSPVISDVCAKVGISQWSFHSWKSSGAALDEDINNGDLDEDSLSEMDTLRLDFYLRTQEAIKSTRFDIAANWTREAKTDWRAGRDLLRMTDPDNWNPTVKATVKAEVTGAGGAPVKMDLGLGSLSLAALREVIRGTSDLAEEDDEEDQE